MKISQHGAAILAAAGIASLLAGATTVAAEDVADQYPDYFPAATIIKCPHIPDGLVDIPTCQGFEATCVGTDGDDLLIGSEEGDVIYVGTGNDVVHGDAGDDLICGGPGNDSLFGARGADEMYGEDGNDWLFGAQGEDLLDGGPGDFDVLWGGPGIDVLEGGPGDHDVCMLQREMGTAEAGCDSQYPPPGYVHDEEPEPGILKLSKVGD